MLLQHKLIIKKNSHLEQWEENYKKQNGSEINCNMNMSASQGNEGYI
jgi:hypothetical protein